MDFSELVKAQLAGEVIRQSWLIRLHFKSGIQRYWQGNYPLTTNDGQVWQPAFDLVARISGLSQSINGTAPELVIELSGVDKEFMKLASGATSEFKGRSVFVFEQFFNGSFKPLSSPFAIGWGLMRDIGSRRQSENGVVVESLTLSAESPFDGRVRPVNARLTDRDQQTRYNGDKIAGQIAGLEGRVVDFPIFGKKK